MAINYKGNFINQLYKSIERNSELTLGEILFSFLREQRLEKHYFKATDQEIYNSLEKFNKEPDEDEDVPLQDREFAEWVGKTLLNMEEEEVEKILFVEERKDDKEKQGYIFALEQFAVIKK